MVPPPSQFTIGSNERRAMQSPSAKSDKNTELEIAGSRCPPSISFSVKSTTTGIPRDHVFCTMPSASHGSEATSPRNDSQLAPVVSAIIV